MHIDNYILLYNKCQYILEEIWFYGYSQVHFLICYLSISEELYIDTSIITNSFNLKQI